MRHALLAGALALALAGCTGTHLPPAASDASVSWRFDNLESVGGLPVHREGAPWLERTPAGPAVAFDGIDDALYLGTHPLAGAETFTIEAIFRPDGGAFEQRWLHLAEVPGGPAADDFRAAPPSGPRFLFEIRVVEDGWYLDAFAAGPGYNKALIAAGKRFPLGRWYHVAQSYDGRVYRSYVDGVLQAEAEIAFRPQGGGYASVGTRIDRRSYFAGAVFAARFSRKALTPASFMSLPPGLR